MRKRHLVVALLAIAGISAGVWWSLTPGLPAAEQQPQASLRLLDRNEAILRDVPSASGERGIRLSIEEIPPELQRAIVLAEDKRFFDHAGVDWGALARASWQNLTSGRRISGGSTITMQAARMTYGIGHGYLGKLEQILKAYRIESLSPKGEILEYYLNHVPFGNNVTGIGQACRVYFDSDCSRLSTAQMATLAVMLRAPSRLYADSDALLARRNRLIAGMRDSGLLQPIPAKVALREELSISKNLAKFQAPHFTEFVRRSLPDTASGDVRTTIDLALQRDLQAMTKYHVDSLREHNVNAAAVLVIDNIRGEVLAYVGSPDYFDEANHGKVDYVQTRRQPGSTVKALTYALALRRGYTPASLVPDLPTLFGSDGRSLRPKNYSGTFSGPRRVREALANSLNVPALHTASYLGETALLAWYHRFGLDGLTESADHYGIGITLGNGEVSLWELTRAFSVFARQGKRITLKYLRDRNGLDTDGEQQVVDPRIAYLIADMLHDPLAREEEFGRSSALDFSFPVAAKTGTSTDFRDNWVIGFTREVTVGVWVGNESGKGMRSVSGITGAGPLFHQVMERVMQSRSKRWLDRPTGIVARNICPLSGELAGPDCDGAYRELFLATNVPEKHCSFHHHARVLDCDGAPATLRYIDVPPLYVDWARTSRAPLLEQVLRDKCGDRASGIILTASRKTPERIALIEPVDGSIYAIDSAIPMDHQILPLRLLLPADASDVRVMVDGKAANTRHLRPDVLLWPLQRGRHVLVASYSNKNGKRIDSDAVHITVR